MYAESWNINNLSEISTIVGFQQCGSSKNKSCAMATSLGQTEYYVAKTEKLIVFLTLVMWKQNVQSHLFYF